MLDSLMEPVAKVNYTQAPLPVSPVMSFKPQLLDAFQQLNVISAQNVVREVVTLSGYLQDSRFLL